MEFTMELDPGQCPMVVSNADRIEQVLVILLDNVSLSLPRGCICLLYTSLNLPDRVLRIIISPLADEEGHPAGAVGLFSDITQSERLERTRRDYVANVSHEMRTPLTAMRALVEPMRDGMVKSEQARQRYYDIILRETLRLSRLIDDLMQLSKLQSGNLALTTEPISLNTLLQDIAEKYRSTAAEAGMEFTMELDPGQCPVSYTHLHAMDESGRVG